MRVRVGTLEELRARGQLVGKAGSHGVCVFWDGQRPWALDDRCPHMGFPLHRGTVEEGLVTCHWHHARFDLATGGTLDPFADDARAFPVEVEGGDVFVVVAPDRGRRDDLGRRLREGLEQGLTLVTAKSVLGLLEAGADPTEIVRTGVEFGTANRREGWGAGLTVLVAMANLLPWLDGDDQALALVHGLAFVSRDTRNHAPAFSLTPLGRADVPPERLATWYRRFVETRSGSAAERVLITAVAAGRPPEEVADMMLAAATDHVFLDGGHTLDFTNKAFEALALLGWEHAADVLPTLVDQTAGASRSEEGGRWRHPHDLVGLVRESEGRLTAVLERGPGGGIDDPQGVSALGWDLLGDDPVVVVDAICSAAEAGATPEQLGRALALAAGLRITRFHTQNDFGDWDVVHHGFTAANALHAALRRHPSPELARGVLHGALRVYLDRFLNVPAARLPTAEPGPRGLDAVTGELADLQSCWDEQGGVDRAGAIAYGFLRGGGDPRRLVAALAGALLAEDAAFHWYQTVEAGVAQFSAWPQGSEEGALLLAGTARFLAAHTPTRRELPHVVRIAARLRRGEDLFEEE
ncbi:MAG TPA: Rieske 2Fe-2S domain-containing protein [Acidimicrobiales bacterium]|nr:Rieske 2Fe-2S domain-containing protein [Acidimicrobiales bacterium]